MKRINAKGGFTLIELLVVIAIIGILASIILVSLNSARQKGNDTRIISDVNEARTQLESDYNGTSYPTIKDTDTFPTGGNYDTLNNDAKAEGPGSGIQIRTKANGSTFVAYAVYAALKSTNNGNPIYFCVDNSGNATTTPTAPSSGNNCVGTTLQ